MTFLHWLGFILAIVLLLLAAFIAWTPWRTHGGRFVTEYLLLAAPLGIVGALILWWCWPG